MIFLEGNNNWQCINSSCTLHVHPHPPSFKTGTAVIVCVCVDYLLNNVVYPLSCPLMHSPYALMINNLFFSITMCVCVE